MKQQTWVEKFRPHTLDDILGQEQNIGLLRNMIAGKQFPHLILYGPPGTGKSSAAQCYYNALFQHLPTVWSNTCYKILNSSDHRTSETLIRHPLNGLQSFLKLSYPPIIPSPTHSVENTENITQKYTVPFLVILEEADNILPSAQEELKMLMDQYKNKMQLILVVNDESCVIDKLKNSMIRLKFDPLPVQSMISFLYQKCGNTQIGEIPWSIEAISLVVHACHGDARKCLNTMQSIDAHVKNNDRQNISTIVSPSDIQNLLPKSPKMHVFEYIQHIQSIWQKENESKQRDPHGHELIQKSLLSYVKQLMKLFGKNTSDVYKWLHYWFFEIEQTSSVIRADFRQFFLSKTNSLFTESDQNPIHLANTSNHHWIGFVYFTLSLFDNSLCNDGNGS